MFLSHTAELRQYPEAESFVAAAEKAVTRAGDVPVDMQYFTARDDKPADYCRRKVRESDVFVGLLGFRYGSPVRDDESRSYVELEYGAAEEYGLPLFVFALSDVPAVPLPVGAVTDPEFGSRQLAFRQRMRDAALVPEFASPERLHTLLFQALTDLHDERRRAPLRPVPFMAPPLDAALVDRPELMDAAVAAVTAHGPGGAVGLTTALRGTGGFGKTTLAAQLCHRTDVRQHFRDGVLWKTVGEQAADGDVARMINELTWQLTGESPPLSDPMHAGAHLAQAMGEQRLLLVVDDVWTRRQLDPFLVGGAHAVRLVTTREADLLPEGIAPIVVDAMALAEAEQLLRRGLPELPDASVKGLLRLTGRWPVLLRLVNGAIRDDVQMGLQPAEVAADLVEQLQVAGPTVLDVADPEQRHAAVASTLDVSLRRLDDDELDRFLQLAVFPEDTDVPQYVLERLWADELDRRPGRRAFQVRRLLARLTDRSLVLSTGSDPPGVRLHDVVRGYLRTRAADRLVDVNRELVQASRPPGGGDGWWALPDDDRYTWAHLAHHLAEGGLGDELRRTLHDLRYVARKIALLGPAAAEADLALDDTPASRALATVIRQSSHLLGPVRPEAALDATILSRVRRVDALRPLADAFDSTLPRPFLTTVGHPPDRSSPALRRVLLGHTGAVRLLVAAPHGEWLASAGEDGSVRLWDPDTGAQRHHLAGHTAPLMGLVVDPSGRWLASAGEDGTVRVWDPDTGVRRHLLTGHTGPVVDLAAAPSGRWLASAGEDGTVRIWDPDAGAQRLRLTGHTDWVSALVVDPAGRWLASASEDATVRIWDPDTGAAGPVLTGWTGQVLALAVHPAGRWLVTGHSDGTLRLWEPGTGTLRSALTGHTGPVYALAADPGGRWLASGSNDRSVRIWDPDTGTATHVLTGHTSWVGSLAVDPGGRWLASAGNDRSVRVWDPEAGTETRVLTGHTSRLTCAAVDPGGRWLATGSNDRSVRVWDPAVQQESRAVPGHTGAVHALARDPAGRWFATAGDDRTVRLWDPESNAQVSILVGHTDRVRSLAVDPHGRWLASGGGDWSVRIWDPEAGSVSHVRTRHKGTVAVLLADPAGRWLASGSNDWSVRVWDPVAGVHVHHLDGHGGAVLALAVHPAGRWLASAGEDHDVRVWDPVAGTLQHLLDGHGGAVLALAVHPAGRWLASAGRDRTVRVWDPDTGAERHLLTGHTGPVHALAVDPAGQWLASAGEDRSVRVWDPDTGSLRTTLSGHTGAVHGLAVDPAGEWLASVGVDRTVRVHRLPEWQEVGAIRVDARLYSCILSSGDSPTLVLAGDNGPHVLQLVT